LVRHFDDDTAFRGVDTPSTTAAVSLRAIRKLFSRKSRVESRRVESSRRLVSGSCSTTSLALVVSRSRLTSFFFTAARAIKCVVLYLCANSGVAHAYHRASTTTFSVNHKHQPMARCSSHYIQKTSNKAMAERFWSSTTTSKRRVANGSLLHLWLGSEFFKRDAKPVT
jgi:hypothetical protein